MTKDAMLNAWDLPSFRAHLHFYVYPIASDFPTDRWERSPSCSICWAKFRVVHKWWDIAIVWRNRATTEQKRIDWEIAVRIEKILCTVLHEAHERQVEETMQTLSERPEGFYG
jgi:hypothetical protein